MLQVRCAHPTGVFAPKRLFKPFRCSAWLIPSRQRTALSGGKRACFRFAALTLRVTSHRPSSLSCAGVAHGLFYDSAPTHLRCAGVPLGLFGKPKRSSSSRFAASRFRTAPPLVRRCSARLIRQAETLELQPLRGLHQTTPWLDLQNVHDSGSLRSPCGYRGAEGQPLRPLRRPAPPFAPKRLFKPFRCSAWLIPYRQRTALSVGKRSCFRFAALTLRVQGSRRATPQALRGDERVFQEQDR